MVDSNEFGAKRRRREENYEPFKLPNIEKPKSSIPVKLLKNNDESGLSEIIKDKGYLSVAKLIKQKHYNGQTSRGGKRRKGIKSTRKIKFAHKKKTMHKRRHN